jgi:hypothetical protein
VNQKPSIPSLLPCLEPDDGKIHIDIIGAPADGAESIFKRFPFRVLSESSPLTRLLRAEILTDAGSLVQPVFLLVQKDTYRYQPSELWPLTNLDIEACWQQAHTFFAVTESGKTPIGHDVIRLDSSRNAFQSLFFCTHRRLFFHPPCPGCGQSLSLCKDGPLLLSQGLSAYSASLRRYLYCPSCPPAKEGNGFYVLSSDTADPAGVQDCSGLIAAWRYLLAGGLAPVGFPCLNCPEHLKCHGPENLAAARIIPFGFYPFHMLVVKAMTIRAADFLPLVSGASIDEMEKRLREPSGLTPDASSRLFSVSKLGEMIGEKDLFLFDGTEKHFLEVLYLKLSFLNEITEMTQTRAAPLDINAALDCLWVKIPNQGGLLPGLWSFTVGYMDIGLTRQTALGHPGTHPAQISYFLGLVWFHVLLTNASQPAAAVIATVVELLQKNRETDTDIKNAPIVGLENIFWHPAAHHLKEFPFNWKKLWEKTLGLAWGLLTADRPGYSWSSDKFRQDLSSIRNEVKRELFVEGAAPAIATVEELADELSDNRAIHKILTGIIGKWETAFNSVQPRTSGPEDTQAETILLTRDKVEDPLQETVIVTKDNIPEAIEKTVVLPRVKTGAPIVGPPIPTREKNGDEPCETVILSGKTTGKSFVPPVLAPKVEPSGTVHDEDVILSETIILRPPKK